MTSLKTPLRYPGGKSKAVKRILSFFPANFAEYREPFLGGGSVFLAVKQQTPEIVCKISDLNLDVFSFWKTLKERRDQLIAAITETRTRVLDGKSLHLKLSQAKACGFFGKALRYYLLNRITYSGTVDCGGYSRESFEKRFTISKIMALRPLAELLIDVEIANESYEKLLLAPGNDVFIFLDPPYWNARKSPLYGRNGNLNKFFDHSLFAQYIRKCPHKWLITCDDSEPIRNLFSFANIYPWELKYNGLNKKTAIMGKELFITNYEIQDAQAELEYVHDAEQLLA